MDEGKFPEQGLPGGKEFSGRHQGTLLGFEPDSFWISGVTVYQEEKADGDRFTFSIRKEDVKRGQRLVSSCLGKFAPTLGRKACKPCRNCPSSRQEEIL